VILSGGKKVKRRIKKLSVDEFSGVDRPAMEPALALIFKRAPEEVVPTREQRLMSMLRKPELEKYQDGVSIMTSEEEGHVHLVLLHGSSAGETSYGISSGSKQGHGHPWMINAAGELVIGANEDHTHSVDQASLLAAMREIVIDRTNAPEVVLDVVFAHADGSPVDLEKMSDAEVLQALACGSLIVKNTEGESMGDAAALPDGSFPIRCKADLLTAIELVGGDGDQHQAAAHVVKRARALGLESELPGEGMLAEIAAGPAGSSNTKETTMTTKTEPAAGGVDLQKQIDDLRKENETLKKANATATAVAALADPHRAHYGSLKTDELKAAFLSKSEPERQREIEEIRKGDPVLYKALDGTEFRSSDGDRMIRLAKQADENAQRLAKSEFERAEENLAKRAGIDASHLPGDVKVRSALLKAVDSITDEPTRTAVLEAIRAGNSAMAKSGDRIGTREVPGSPGSPSSDLEAKAREYMAKNAGVDFYTAYDKVATAHPELAKAAVNEQPTAARG